MPAIVHKDLCEGCEDCIGVCPVDAIHMVGDKAEVETNMCTDCHACVEPCPSEAIVLVDEELIYDVLEAMAVTEREPV